MYSSCLLPYKEGKSWVSTVRDKNNLACVNFRKLLRVIIAAILVSNDINRRIVRLSNGNGHRYFLNKVYVCW